MAYTRLEHPSSSRPRAFDDPSRQPTARSRRDTEQFAGLPIAQAALGFASARHCNRYREIDRAPFIAHPTEVGWLLAGDGQPDEVIAAGLLHDILENTPTTSAEIRHRFGIQIIRLVESVSDDPSIGDYSARKRELRDRVAHADSDTVAVFAADKISKVRELMLLPASRLHEPGTRAKLAHYHASRQMIHRVFADVALVELLDDELSRLIARGTPHQAADRLIATSPLAGPTISGAFRGSW